MFELILIIGCVILFQKFLYERRKPNTLFKNIEKNENLKSYIQKPFLTQSEKIFYLKLKTLENMGYKIIPQINLATIIHKCSSQKFHNELFRIVDFGIFDNNFNILLLIELNDSTHNKISRKDRDLKVKAICNSAKIKMLTFYTKYPNEEKYVINRILNEIKAENIQNDDLENTNLQDKIIK